MDELFVYLEQMKRERSEMQRDAASPVFEVGTGFVSPTVMKVGISTFTVSWDSDRDLLDIVLVGMVIDELRDRCM